MGVQGKPDKCKLKSKHVVQIIVGVLIAVVIVRWLLVAWLRHESVPLDILVEPKVIRLPSNATVLLTGGVGFIGFHTALRLKNTHGVNVVAYDNVNDYYDQRLKLGRADQLKEHGIEIIKASVCDAKTLAHTLTSRRITHVVHLAAQAGVRYSLKNPLDYIKNNVECFTVLLEALKQRGIELTYASSSSIYGRNKKVPFSESDDVSLPSSLYAVTKRANELAARAYWNLYKQRSIGLRFFTVYGPWGRPDMAYFSFSENITKGKQLTLFNQGKMSRDFTYIDDIVTGVVASIGEDLEGGVVNLGNNQPEPLNNLVEGIENALGVKAKIRYVGMQKGDVVQTYADISKAQKLLGYLPKTSLAEGIAKFGVWFKNDYPNKVLAMTAEEAEKKMKALGRPVRP